MVTRDSRLLTVLQVASLLLLAMSAASPESLGLTEIQGNWVSLLAGVTGTISGKLSTSPLKGEHDQSRVGGGPR